MEQPRRRLSAVWFADIVGYTELSSRDEPAAMKLVNALQSVARGAVAEFEGRIVKFIGDAVLAEFSSTESAVRAAVALQERYEQAARATGQPSELRIGVHLGEVTATPDGDLYGDGINTAARLQHEAAPGKIIISEDGWRQLRQRPEFRFESLGAVELKGISTAVQIYDVVFGARAALAAASATTPVTPPQPAPVTTAAPRRPLSTFAPPRHRVAARSHRRGIDAAAAARARCGAGRSATASRYGTSAEGRFTASRSAASTRGFSARTAQAGAECSHDSEDKHREGTRAGERNAGAA